MADKSQRCTKSLSLTVWFYTTDYAGSVDGRVRLANAARVSSAIWLIERKRLSAIGLQPQLWSAWIAFELSTRPKTWDKKRRVIAKARVRRILI